jgi:hypothetical protein
MKLTMFNYKNKKRFQIQQTLCWFFAKEPSGKTGPGRAA